MVAAGAIHVLGGPANRAVDRFDGHRWARESSLPGQALDAPAVAAIGSRIGGVIYLRASAARACARRIRSLPDSPARQAAYETRTE